MSHKCPECLRAHCPHYAGPCEHGDESALECGHDSHEDCMNCAVCGHCREDLDSNDICMDCGGVDENEADLTGE